MAKEKTNDNMELWNKVCKTDPAITKKVELRGGFTAIDAQAQIKRATELWGPYGSKWGVKDCHYEFMHAFGESKDQTGIYLIAIFYYPEGEFAIATDMSYQPHNDCMKKLLTDLTTKALSKLGFNSDVFEGKFDDSKYVDEMKKDFGSGKDKPEKEQPKTKLPDDANQYLKSSEIKAYEQDDIKLIKEWGFEENINDEIEHREHINMSFGKFHPTILSRIRWIRVQPEKYDWEKLKNDCLLSDIFKETTEENQKDILDEWKKNNG